MATSTEVSDLSFLLTRVQYCNWIADSLLLLSQYINMVLFQISCTRFLVLAMFPTVGGHVFQLAGPNTFDLPIDFDHHYPLSFAVNAFGKITRPLSPQTLFVAN